MVVQCGLNDIFDGGSGKRGETLFSGGVGLVVHVGVPIDVVSGDGVFGIVVVVVGVGTGWCGGRGVGVGCRVFLGFVGILGGVGAGWGLGGGDAGWGRGWGWSGWLLGGGGTGWGLGWIGVGGRRCCRDRTVDAGRCGRGRLGSREEGWVKCRDGKRFF